jgi:hypothetical protein
LDLKVKEDLTVQLVAWAVQGQQAPMVQLVLKVLGEKLELAVKQDKGVRKEALVYKGSRESRVQ